MVQYLAKMGQSAKLGTIMQRREMDFNLSLHNYNII